MAEILEANLPYWSQEIPELKGQPLVGGRFKYRAGAGRGGTFVRFGRKKIKYTKRNGHKIFKSAKHAELYRIRRVLNAFRASNRHKNAIKRNKGYKFYRYHGPGYRATKALRALKKVQSIVRAR